MPNAFEGQIGLDIPSSCKSSINSYASNSKSWAAIDPFLWPVSDPNLLNGIASFFSRTLSSIPFAFSNDSSEFLEVLKGDADVEDGNLVFTATGSDMAMTVNFNQRGVPEVRAKDLRQQIRKEKLIKKQVLENQENLIKPE